MATNGLRLEFGTLLTLCEVVLGVWCLRLFCEGWTVRSTEEVAKDPFLLPVRVLLVDDLEYSCSLALYTSLTR